MASGKSPHYDYERDCEPWEHLNRRKRVDSIEFLKTLRDDSMGLEAGDRAIIGEIIVEIEQLRKAARNYITSGHQPAYRRTLEALCDTAKECQQVCPVTETICDRDCVQICRNDVNSKISPIRKSTHGRWTRKSPTKPGLYRWRIQEDRYRDYSEGLITAEFSDDGELIDHETGIALKTTDVEWQLPTKISNPDLICKTHDSGYPCQQCESEKD